MLLRNAALRVVRFIWGADPKYRDRTSLTAIMRLVLVAGGLYAIAACLVTYWSPWNRAYQYYFRSFGDVAFSQFLLRPHASVRFLDLDSPTLIDDIRSAALPHTFPDGFPVPERDQIQDTLMVLKNTGSDHPGIGLLRTSSRPIGYWPTTMIIALALATPWTWKRRRWVLLWGFVLVHAFLATRLSIFLLKGGFADASKRFRLFEWSEVAFANLKRIDEVINDDPAINFVIPFVVWMVVMIGAELWRSWRENAAASPRRTRRRLYRSRL